MNTPHRQYLGSYFLGRFVPITDSNGEIESRNPGDLDTPVVKCAFSYDHVQEAVASAARGSLPWKRMALSDRLTALFHYRKVLEERSDFIAQLISFETGIPFWEARSEMLETLSILDYYLESAKLTPLESHSREAGSGYATQVNHFPRGIAAIITPAIHPIADTHVHLIPALIYGNTAVVKASRKAPLVGQAIAEAMHDAQMPPDVFNLVQGDSEVARRLVGHPDVQIVFYTGSYDTAVKIQKQVLSDYWKVLVLDMAGKNGVLVWDDAHYAQALQETVYSAFLTTGQRRTTASRVLVHSSLVDRFQNDLHALAKKASVGYGYTPSAEGPFMGPLLHDEAVEHYIRVQGIAVREGCEEIMRGKSLERSPKGHYVSPSIHRVVKADPKSVYQKTEIFGPNIALYSIDDLEEAIEVLNLSQHGLVASVYTQNRDVFLRACENVRVGMLHWNRHTHTDTYRLPRGGIKKSGNSRPMGSLAWQQCTYPVASTERLDGWDKLSLPKSLPTGGAG
jgi:succinylglutamic semialdehyde dehydrogenase